MCVQKMHKASVQIPSRSLVLLCFFVTFLNKIKTQAKTIRYADRKKYLRPSVNFLLTWGRILVLTDHHILKKRRLGEVARGKDYEQSIQESAQRYVVSAEQGREWFSSFLPQRDRRVE